MRKVAFLNSNTVKIMQLTCTNKHIIIDTLQFTLPDLTLIEEPVKVPLNTSGW
jgi:hypothetical protein